MARTDQTSDLDRTAANAAGVTGALVHTKDLDDFKLPEHRPDPRGWDVRATDGRKIGKVEDLLVDTASRQIRYVEIAVADDVAKAGGRDYVLVPIGAARLDDDRDDVVVSLSADDLRDVPLYDRTRVSRDYERSLHGFLDDRSPALRSRERTTASTPADRADFYAGPYYDDRSFFGTRARGAGARDVRTAGAADRATTTGLADRITDAADNLKDRIDANPASRPGPDATDRPI